MLEKQAACSRSELFEQLLVQMLDMDLGTRVSTPSDIAASLSLNGWSLPQIASVWTVSSGTQLDNDWTDSALEALGGKGTVSRVWNHLKDSSMTGFPKRQASPCLESHNKKIKLQRSPCSDKVSTVRIGSGAASIVDDSAAEPPTSVSVSSCFPRKIFKAARRYKLPGQGKITWWLKDQDEQLATSACSSPQVIPATPSPKDSKKKARRQRRKKNSKQTPGAPPMPPRSLDSSSAPPKQPEKIAVPRKPVCLFPRELAVEPGAHVPRQRKKTSDSSPREKAPLRTPPSFPPSPDRVSPQVCSRRFLVDDASPSLRAKRTGLTSQDGAQVAAQLLSLDGRK